MTFNVACTYAQFLFKVMLYMQKVFKYILDSVSELIKETKSVTMNSFRKKNIFFLNHL